MILPGLQWIFRISCIFPEYLGSWWFYQVFPDWKQWTCGFPKGCSPAETAYVGYLVHPCAIRTYLFESQRDFVACNLPLLSVKLTYNFPVMEKLRKRVFQHVREILYTLNHYESPSCTLYLFCRGCRELQWSCIYVKIRNKTVMM